MCEWAKIKLEEAERENGKKGTESEEQVVRVRKNEGTRWGGCWSEQWEWQDEEQDDSAAVSLFVCESCS